MDVIIREGKKEDIPQVLELVNELAEYERAPREVTNTEEEMLRDGFGVNPVYGMFVAELDKEIVGMAIHYIRYSTWKGRCLYLEDIVVKENFRGKQIGRMLFNEVALLAKRKNYAALVWQILDWNEPALNFYRKYNAEFDDEWVTGKLTKAQLTNFQPL
ncbi:MAG: GNAT family N-acetyltransferase [Flavobacteriales bacterium]|nr:GNAT family N-acetyltransferase [Flavobacteriales bacterium]